MLGLLWREKGDVPPLRCHRDGQGGRTDDYAVAVTFFTDWACGPFRALGDLKLDLVALSEGFVACRLNR